MSHKYSKETLWHFQCCVCSHWWTIGDFDTKHIAELDLYCPNCGELADYEEIEEIKRDREFIELTLERTTK